APLFSWSAILPAPVASQATLTRIADRHPSPGRLNCRSMANKEPVPLCIGVLTISDTRTQANDKSGRLISESLSQAGHSVTVHRIVPDEVEAIRSTFAQWQQQSLDVVISTGGTGLTQRDVTQEA